MAGIAGIARPAKTAEVNRMLDKIVPQRGIHFHPST